MKTSKLIKIFIINTVSVIIVAKVLPILFRDIPERTFERILLIYFLIFNLVLLINLIKNKED